MYSKEIAGIYAGFIFNSMTKHRLKFLILAFALSLSCFLESRAQLIQTGLVEDFERNTKIVNTDLSNLKTSATTYSDTLQIPFFEDFTDVVVPIDSIVIDNTTDSLVKIYDNILNSFPDGTLIHAGFTSKAPSSSSAFKIARQRWYIKKIGTNEFLIDSTIGLATPMKIDIDTLIKTSYWRLILKNYSTDIDTLKWVQGGNTYINNRYPSKPVSYHVATFDGLKSDGVPYNTTNVLAKGFSDYLTSLPINLKSFSASDNLYLSFFWQHSGVGDAPESDDYLQLEFKDSTGIWNVMETISGNLPYMDTFKIEIKPVTNPIYFFKHFQFRLRSYGRLSGPYDIWNVDHIYLNKNRSANDTIFYDKTIGNMPATFLKRYTSMPYNQFFADTVAESGEMIFTDNNLGRGVVDAEFYNVIAEYYSRPNNLFISSDTAQSHFPGNILFPNDNVRTFQDTCRPNVKLMNNIGAPIYVEQNYKINTSDTTNILFANNNTFSNKTILWDYYAYDDGSPEWGVGANQTGAKIANQFTLKLMDTLTHIDIYFTRSKGPNMNGRSILLSVWDSNKSLVSQQTIQVSYGGFKRYYLNTPVIIGAGMDYYVGYQQNFIDLLSVGYDKNYDHSDKIYFSLGSSSWDAYNMQPGYVKGSMMIRPVFNKNQILITPVIPEEEEEEVVLYPVPTNDVLKIQGRINRIVLYDLSGRKAIEQTFDPFFEGKEINTSDLGNGFYIAELSINNSVLIKKIIIQR